MTNTSNDNNNNSNIKNNNNNVIIFFIVIIIFKYQLIFLPYYACLVLLLKWSLYFICQ